MISTAIDPALLKYDCKDLDTKGSCCIERLEALTMHREVINKYNLRIATSKPFTNYIMSLFPWKQTGNYMLRDLRELILIDLQKANYVMTTEDNGVEISPEGVVCQYIKCQDLVHIWYQLLLGCVTDDNSNQSLSTISTWRCPSIVPQIELTVMIANTSKADIAGPRYSIPLVWDYDSWVNQLVTQDWWPDIHRMVELTFTTTAIRNHPKVRASPINFTCSEGFWQSADTFCCDNPTRQFFIKALTKVVYGLYDKGLGLEPVQSSPGLFRFRVTSSMRVHFHKEGEKLIIDNIGPHRLDGIG